MEENKWSKNCCNSFKKSGHWVTKDLKKVSNCKVSLNCEIKSHMKICTSCRLQLRKEEPFEDFENADPNHIDESEYVNLDIALSYFNVSLISLGKSPVSTKGT